MNFIITFKKGKDGKEGVFIRELEHLYVIGQEEPKLEVYPPQSKQYNNFLKKKIQTYTYKLYNEIGFNAGINFKVFSNLFPTVTEQILKKNFREMKIEIDKNICYYTKIPTEDNNMQITPENICQYETSQFGLHKLRDMGIKTLTNPEKISYSTNKFIQQVKNPEEQFLSRVIEAELLSTPWNITQNFLNAKQTNGMLSIKGTGDPSNGNGGYSFLKMPVKSYNENNKSIKEEIDNLKKQNNNLVKTVTGTDADLRKLSKEDIKLKLIQLGIEDDYINKLSRWERVSVLRYKSTQVASIVRELLIARDMKEI
jgi:transcription initiation factor TFIID subunit 1